MSRTQEPSGGIATPAAAACWNSIGVWGDSSCPQLERHVHCRNCPVYSAAAVDLLDTDPPPGYLAHWTGLVAQTGVAEETEYLSVVVFRIGTEWLALRTTVLTEIVSSRAMHSIPHRRNGVVLGLVNIHGELLACFSLQVVLGLDQTTEPKRTKQLTVAERFLVIQRSGNRAVFPVQQVHGIAHIQPRDVTPVPANIANATAAYTRAVLSWEKRSVGLLDDESLFNTVNRALA